MILALAALPACGKKGPPLPPLVRMPVAPADFTAERRGNSVDLMFVVPAQNTDESRPADISRVDVYALNAAAPVSDDIVADEGVRVGSVNVKPPDDEDVPAEATPAVTDVAVAADGVDQGATAHVTEDLTAEAMLVPASRGAAAAADGRPLLGPSTSVPARTYVSVGVSERGRRGPLSRAAAVPLVAAPAPPPQPEVSYSETAVTVSWAHAAPESTGAAGVLPSRALPVSALASSFHVYELGPAGEAGAARIARRLTAEPIVGGQYVDERVEWGAERCYTVSVVRSFASLSVESETADPRCVEFVDTFAPAAPAGLTSVAAEGAISLIWTSNTERDLAGYIVLRGAPGSSAEALAPITPKPIQESSYRDPVETGATYMYAVRAVDAAGNASAPSPPVEETAR